MNVPGLCNPMAFLRTLAVAGALGVPALASPNAQAELTHDSVSLTAPPKQPTKTIVDADGTFLYRYGNADRLGQLVDQGHLGDGPNDLKALDREHGVAVLSGKDFPSDQLTVPLAPITGMEDPRLLQPGAENYFADAWKYAKNREGVALAVNSQGGRSQDRLHIHADKIDPELSQQLKQQLDQGQVSGEHFSPLNPIHGNHQYRAVFLEGDELIQNPMQLVHDQLVAEHGEEYARTHLGQHSIAVVPMTDARGKKGFLVIDGRYGSDPSLPKGPHDSGSAEEWLMGHANAPP
ncbi:CDP-diacylglycerol diphosphatase [bacterium]|nr:CDP-diacylglycerol diphosphatase [bacterium]